MNFSTFSALSELLVTAAVFYVVLTDLKGGPFAAKLALAVIIFEFSVNMLYMMHRMQQVPHEGKSAMLVAFAAIHGSLSLVVFLAFVVLACLAYMDSRRGKHFFAEHRGYTYTFLILWIVSVGSGEVLYFIS